MHVPLHANNKSVLRGQALRSKITPSGDCVQTKNRVQVQLLVTVLKYVMPGRGGQGPNSIIELVMHIREQRHYDFLKKVSVLAVL